MVALGLELAARGHRVTVAAPANFAGWVEGHGLRFAPVGPDMESQVRQFGDRAHATLSQMRILRTEILPHQFETLPEICAGADLLIGAGMQVAGPSVAERLDIPYAFVAYAPAVLRSAHHAPPVVRPQRLPRVVNRVCWRAFDLLLGRVLSGPISRGRVALSLPPVRDVAGYLTAFPIIVAADTALTGDVPDLPAVVSRVPALRHRETGGLPADVEAFLETGPPPLSVGFGSMATDRAHDLLTTFVRAAALAGLRLIVQPGWTGLGARDLQVPPHCMVAGALSHAALLPRVCAAVHHGGAGTTASVARAARPQRVIPHLLDQFYWAGRVRALGLGPRPIPVASVRDADRLARVLRGLVETESYRRNAAAVAGRLSEDGVRQAAALVERL